MDGDGVCASEGFIRREEGVAKRVCGPVLKASQIKIDTDL